VRRGNGVDQAKILQSLRQFLVEADEAVLK
jgi:hypothetical protein